MKFKYIDFLSSNDKKIVKKIYHESFDKDERFPFWILKKCSKENNVNFNVIYSNNKVIGFQYIIEYDNINYLMYFAIEKNKRNNGYGSEILKKLNKSDKKVLLSIEKPIEKVIDSKYERKQFYLRNGFISTNKYIIDNNVEYELLCSNSNLNITKEMLEKRYTMMTSSKILRFIISKIFNVYNIKFIENKNQFP